MPLRDLRLVERLDLCRRFGSHPVTVVCAVLLSLGVALPPLTHSALALGAVLLIFGAAFGGINVAFNSAAVDLVAALRRPVMSGFHAAFSLGGMIGAGLGGLVAGSLSATRHLLGITVIGLLVTAADVIHAWAMPAFGVKKDAVPGRTNETWFKAEREGTYYGQCSELCGVNHSFMPIEVKIVPKEEFQAWVQQAQQQYPRVGAAPAQPQGQPVDVAAAVKARPAAKE